MPSKHFGVWQELRILRERTGINSSDLAKEARMAKSYLSQLENGDRWPTSTVTKKLADALKVPYTVLERPTDQKIGAVS